MECRFCGNHFKTKSTYGRHLDSKKGDSQHPANEVEVIRKDVVRRGEKRPPTEESKARRLKASKTYNDKDSVKEKNKLRRKNRDEQIKAKLQAAEWYLHKISGSTYSQVPKLFPYLVASHVSLDQWPEYDEVPGRAEFNHLLAKLKEVDEIYESYRDWKQKDEDARKREWHSEAWRALKEMKTSLWELRNAPSLVEEKQKEIYESYGDVFQLLVDSDE